MRLGKTIALVAALLFVGGVVTWALWPQPWRPDTHTEWPPKLPYDPIMGPAPQQPEVFWGEYRQGFRKDIDRAGDDGDCVALKRYQQEGLSSPTEETLGIKYINYWGIHLNCSEFAPEIADAKELETMVPMPTPSIGASCAQPSDLQFTPENEPLGCRDDHVWEPTTIPTLPILEPPEHP